MNPIADSILSTTSIFYIEDDQANVSLMKLIIKRAGNLTLETARSAEEGLPAIAERQPDLVLMDINLPGLSGIDATRKLKENKATSHIPVVAVSANATTYDKVLAKSADFFCYLTKPLNVGDVREVIVAAVGGEKRSIEPDSTEQEAPPQVEEETGILSASAIEIIQRSKKTLPDGYIDVIRKMFLGIPELRDKLQSALDTDDFKSAETAAHKLKTYSATLGAVKLSKMAEKAEFATKNENLNEITELLQEMSHEYYRVTPAIEKLLES